MPVYLMNTIIPAVLFFGLGVAATILGRERALNFLSRLPFDLTSQPDLIIVLLFTILLGSFVITGSAISIEGKHFELLCSGPVDEKTLFASKIGANVLLGIVVLLLTYPWLLGFMNLAYWWCYLVLPLVAILTTSTLGLVINLNYPKLEWEREEQVIKSSMASLLSFMIPFVIGIFPVPLYFISLKNYLVPQIFLLLVALYYLIIFLICLLWLNHKGKKALFSAFSGGKL